ncbi:hypothetical protein [Halomonas sp. DN3]|uniref:hypothetical protein n=1 Tax=Halomonas sp. DN3 TaxID=2953657 RepID=UPI0020A1B5AF|nr:hypothetical protein [Halomonas sp. DN3]USZ48143.1 hypothetical protein NKF27_11440 [Halomonas sp. DN3]
MIEYIVECPDKVIDLQCDASQGYVEVPAGFDDAAHYVDLDDGEIKAKQPQRTSITVDGLVVTIEGLAAGTKVTVGSSSIVADDAPTELAFDVPGTYTVELMGAAPHLDETLEVVVNG